MSFWWKWHFWPQWPHRDLWPHHCLYVSSGSGIGHCDQVWSKSDVGKYVKKMCCQKKLECVPFPRARVKLGGRVSSYQVTQPLTYIFEPLTVGEIQGLLQTLFMYAQCQHPQPLVTWRGHHVHFLMFGKDKIHWQCYSCHMKLFEVWPFWPLTSFP